MADERDLRDDLAIRETLARYCHTCDDGAFEALGALFAEDGSFEYAGALTSGRAALVAHFARIQPPERRGKHLTSNVVVALDGDRATAVSDWVFLVLVDGVPTPRLTGRYRDELVREQGEWVFARRVVEPLAPPAG